MEPADGAVDAAAPLLDAHLDQAPPDDQGPERPDGPCAAAEPLSHLGDGRWHHAGSTGPDLYASRCGGAGGADALLVFRAPQAGRWRFHAVSPDFDPMLSARGDCVLAASERACNDDVGWPRRRDAALQLDLAVDETVYLVVDAYTEPGGRAVAGAFEVEAERVPVQGREAPCDPWGIADGCRLGDYCAPEHPGLLGGPGACRPDTAPRWVQLPTVRFDGQVLTVVGEASDAAGDVVALHLQLLDAEGEPVLLGQSDLDTAGVALEVRGETRFAVRLQAVLPQPVSGAVSARVWLIDARGHACAPAVDRFSPLPVRRPGASCDPDRLLDRCQAGTACPGAAVGGVCEPVHPPFLESASLHRAASGAAVGLVVSGRDADADVRGAWIGVTDARGRLVAEAVRLFDHLQVGPGGAFEAALSFAAHPELTFGDALVVLFDAEGLQSEPVRLPVAPPETVAADEPCDPLGARTLCPAGLDCFAPLDSGAEGPGVPTASCGTPPTECAEHQRVLTLATDGAGGFEVAFDLWGAPAGEAASCGGGVSQAVVPFTAPSEGRWSLSLEGEGAGADPVLSIRRHCAFGVAFSERACNDDRGPETRDARLELRLRAGETIYVVADGYRGSDGWWSGPVRLHLRPAR